MIKFVTYDEFEKMFGREDNLCADCEYKPDTGCRPVHDCWGGLYVDIPQEAEPVVNPTAVENLAKQNHYNFRGGIEAKDFCLKHDVTGPEWNVVKYVYRHAQKDGAKDIRKAIIYCGYQDADKCTIIKHDEIEEFIMSNNMTYREAMVIKSMFLGAPVFAWKHLKKLLKEVYGEEA